MKKTNKFVRHVISAVVAQGFSLLQSLFMTFVVAKILSNSVFSWWQWFLYLAGLTHYIHIGVGEGILLKTGGTAYKKLDYDRFGGVFWKYASLQAIACVGIIGFSVIRYAGSADGICIVLAALFMVASNLSYFLSQLLIATNRTADYSKAVVINKTIMLIASLCLLLGGYRNYIWFAVMYCVGQYCELLLCCRECKEVVWCRKKRQQSYYLREMLDDAKAGIVLSVSTLLANLVSNIGRACVKVINGLLDFGALSMANSLCSFFLMFIRQVGVVLFPFLRNADYDKRKRLFVLSNQAICLITLGILCFYYPVRFLLEQWLPSYRESFAYLVYIMPVVVLDSQMSVLNTPYLNAMRKEKRLLLINLTAFLVTLVVTLISIGIFNSMELVALSITVGMVVKSLIGTISISKSYEVQMGQITRTICFELALLVVFVLTARNNTIWSWLVYLGSYVGYCCFNRDILSVAKFKRMM